MSRWNEIKEWVGGEDPWLSFGYLSPSLSCMMTYRLLSGVIGFNLCKSTINFSLSLILSRNVTKPV